MVYSKKTTIYFDPVLHKALQVKAMDTGRSVSELVNQAVKLALAEDAEDLVAFEERRYEHDLPFEEVIKKFKY